MRAKALVRKKSKKRLPQEVGTVRAKVSEPFSLHRRNRFEFSCAVEFDPALLVDESLDERERRG